MWITCTNPATRSLRRPYMDEPIEFSDNGLAQVSSDVGEQLVEDLDAVEVHEPED